MSLWRNIKTKLQRFGDKSTTELRRLADESTMNVQRRSFVVDSLCCNVPMTNHIFSFREIGRSNVVEFSIVVGEVKAKSLVTYQQRKIFFVVVSL